MLTPKNPGHLWIVYTRKTTMQNTEKNQEPERKGLVAVAHTYAQAVEALASVNGKIAAVAEQIAEINPASNLRPQKMRKDNRKLAGSESAARVLGRAEQPTSAVRLRLNACGASTCSGCPHPHWGVWRAYAVGGELKRGMTEVKNTVQLLAYARHAADPMRTVQLVQQALDLIARRNKLVGAFASLGRIARA